ncbi:MAG: rRNA maturation RNase YbeY [Pseudomonadota bacterium]
MSGEAHTLDVTVDVAVATEDWARDVANITPLVESAVAAGQAESGGAGGDISLLLTDDTAMQALNLQWRQKDKPTDVLAFPAGANAAGFLGDIAVGHGICSTDAGDMGRPLAEHLAHMVIHAYLHLVGYDHETDQEAAAMQALEDRAMVRLGYRAPYGVTPN